MTERTKHDLTILIGRQLKEARRLCRCGCYGEASAVFQRAAKLSAWLARGHLTDADAGAASASRAA